MNLTIKANNPNNPVAIERTSEKRSGKSVDGRIFNFNPESAVDAKRNNARKQAMKLISDAWGRDNKAAQGIRDMYAKKDEKVSECRELSSGISELEDKKEQLRENYGIDADSQEQKDLELLEKYQNNKGGVSLDSFSEEEKDRLKELANIPLTDYQREVLEINKAQGEMKVENNQKQYEILGLADSIAITKIDQEKSQDMLKAQEAADALIGAAEKDIIGMLMQEGKENIDEARKEQEEEAKEAQEKKEEQEECIERAKENRGEQEERIEQAKQERKEQEEILKREREFDNLEQTVSAESQSVDHLSEAKKMIQQIIKDNNMINEDLKGIEIDLDF